MLGPLRTAVVTLASATAVVVVAAMVPELPIVGSPHATLPVWGHDDGRKAASGYVSAISVRERSKTTLPDFDGHQSDAVANAGAVLSSTQPFSPSSPSGAATAFVGCPHIQLGPLLDAPPITRGHAVE